MKKLLVIFGAFVVVALAIRSGAVYLFTSVTKDSNDVMQSAHIIKGSNQMETATFDFEDFDSIEASHSFDIHVYPSDTYSVSVTYNENIKDKLRIKQNGDTLELGLDNIFLDFNNVHLTAEIGMPMIDNIELSGATEIQIDPGMAYDESVDINVSGASEFEGDIDTEDLKIEGSGASEFNMSIYATDLAIDLSGASGLKADGSAIDAKLQCSGASDLDLKNLTIEEADIDVSGASDISLNASESISGEISGVSTLRYSGGADIKNIDISGGSEISVVD